MERDGSHVPVRIINSVAPIRVCDIGGWTDTWFARHGKVFNIAVYPHVEVQVKVYERGAGRAPVIISAENYGERYAVVPGTVLPDRHPLLEAAVDELGVPDHLAIEVNLFSDAPAGCSTGTSASVSVALIAALDALTPGRLTPHEIARAAHRIEVDRLGLQSGVQDQLCAAYGGISFIDITDYPQAVVSPIRVSDSVWWELERRLVLVFLGRTHVSSTVHERVIGELEEEGSSSLRLEELRQAAVAARDALHAGDFDGLGRAMVRNTEAQAGLHPELVSKEALVVIETARQHGAIGWKVNGAGGEGGSITLLASAEASSKRLLVRAVEDADALFQAIPTHLSRSGVRVWDSPIPRRERR